MHNHLLEYFSAEKFESLIFIAVGILAMGISAYLWFSGNTYRMAAVPLTAVAVIQIVVGGTVFFRTDAQMQSLQVRMQSEPFEFRTDELARMKKVQENFRLYKIMEIALLAIGVFLSYFASESIHWYAAAIGLIAQSALMLVADLIAEHRADVYVARLQEFFPNMF